MKYLLSFISPLFELSLRCAPATLAVFYAIFHPCYSSLLLLIGSIIHVILISHLFRFVHDIKSAIELNGFLKEFSHYEFKPTRLEDVMWDSSIGELKAMLRVYKEPIAKLYIPVLKDRSIRTRLCNYRVFPGILFTSIIFLPSSCVSDTIEEKFKFYHELGHLSLGHYSITSFKNHSYAGFAVFMLLLAVLSSGNVFAIVPSFCGYIIYLLNLERLHEYSSTKLESVANIFSMSMLKNDKEFNKVIDFFKNTNIIDVDITDYCLRWINEYVDSSRMKRNVLKFIPATHKARFCDLLSNKAINYYSLVEKLSTPSIVATLIGLLSIVASARYATNAIDLFPTTIVMFLFLVGVPIVLVTIFALYLMQLNTQNAFILNRSAN